MPARQIDASTDLSTASVRDAVVARHLRRHFRRTGFKAQDARRWVDGATPPIRRLFEFQLLKGLSMKACWGFSLDFVPHIAAGRIRWHRSDASARLDVVIDPRDLPVVHCSCCEEDMDRDVGAVLPNALERARRDWDRGKTIEGMRDLICDIRDRETNHFGYANYTQMPIALAFLSAKSKDVSTAERELSRVIDLHALDEAAVVQLRRAIWE